jgi:hypothetical protein
MKRTILSVLMTYCLCGVVCAPVIYTEESCPENSAVTEMISSSATVKAMEPFDFSKIQSSGALLMKNGTKLGVYLSNGDFTIKQMSNSFIVPVKEKGIFIVAINFTNAKKPIEAGAYSASAGYGKPFWVTAEIKVAREEKGAIVSLGVREGTATIIKMTDSSICGTFDLKLKKKDAITNAISGQFNVPLEKSRW